MCSDRYKHPIASFPFTTDELVDNLFAVIQSIVAGTASHSMKMLNEACLQWKIKLSSISPIILLHYEQTCDENERVEKVPVSDFKIMHENSGTRDDINVNNEVNSIILDDRRENSFKIKQEIPEMLLLLNNYDENKDKNKESNQTKSGSIGMNSCTESISSTMNSLSESIDSSSIMEMIPVTASKSKMKTLQKEEKKNCDDQSKRSEKKGNDNGMRKKGRPRKCIEEPYECKICGKRVASPYKLRVHMTIHTGEEPFKCEICGRAFTASSSLIQHERIPMGEKPFKCDTCGSSFRHKSSLSAHMWVHTGEKPFKCEHCGKAFNYSSYLTIHKRIHSGEKPFKCKICGKSFIASNGLTVHERIHTGEKPFKCNVCDRSFTQRANLTQHERIHAGEKGER